MKRSLPSLSSLEVFEACARYANFTRAAEELGITQSAVSRHIAYLEKFLGFQLFERVRRRVLLTESGKEYAESIRRILRQAEKATEEVTASQTGKVLHISSYATFASKWLAPRLVDFAEQHPDIRFQLTVLDHYRAFSSPDSDVDVAIHFGEASWPDALLDRLMHETILPVCSPDYAERNRLEQPSDLRRAVRLHQIKTDSWPDMLKALGVPDDPTTRGPGFDQYAAVIEAALHGMGVGAIPTFLIGGHLKRGELIPLFNKTVKSRYAYHLVYPEAKRSLRRIKLFRRWIVAQARRSEDTYLDYPRQRGEA